LNFLEGEQHIMMNRTLSLLYAAFLLGIYPLDFTLGCDPDEEASSGDAAKTVPLKIAESDKKTPDFSSPIKKLGVDAVEIDPLPWMQLQPCLETLLKETLIDPSYESRTFRFQIKREDWKKYIEWDINLISSSQYPIGYTSTNRGGVGDRVEGLYEIYNKELTLINMTKKEEQARKDFAYHFFKGTLDESHINANTFYNLMVRAGFSPEDFEKGKHDYQERVFVKPITLKQTTALLCNQEIQGVIESTLPKAAQPFVAFVFELPASASFKTQDLLKTERPFPLATIVEEKERRLYLCFSNDQRKRLDLHQMSVEEAFEQVKAFIQERYANYAETCEIITGRGNHENPGGKRALLFSSFPGWMKHKEICPLVKRSIPREGVYIVFLIKPMKCDLTSLTAEQDSYEMARDALRKVSQTTDLRLRIKVDIPDFEPRLIQYLLLKEPKLFQEISPLSLYSLPGELRLNLKMIETPEPTPSSVTLEAGEEEKITPSSSIKSDSKAHTQKAQKKDPLSKKAKHRKKKRKPKSSEVQSSIKGDSKNGKK